MTTTITMSRDKARIRAMADLEEGRVVSVGGLVAEVTGRASRPRPFSDAALARGVYRDLSHHAQRLLALLDHRTGSTLDGSHRARLNVAYAARIIGCDNHDVFAAAVAIELAGVIRLLDTLESSILAEPCPSVKSVAGPDSSPCLRGENRRTA